MADRPRKQSKPSGVHAAKQPERKQRIYDKFNFDDVDKILFATLSRYPETTKTDLADLVGLSRSAVAKRLDKPAFRRAMEEFLGTLEEHICRVQLAAIRRLGALVQSKDEKVALDACRFALTRVLGAEGGGSKLPEGITPAGARAVIFRTIIGETGGLLRQTEIITGIDEIAADAERERAMAEAVEAEYASQDGPDSDDAEATTDAPEEPTSDE